MKKIIKYFGLLAFTFVMALTVNTQSVAAQTVISNPRGGEYKAGGVVPIEWRITGLTPANNSIKLSVFLADTTPRKVIFSTTVSNPIYNKGVVATDGTVNTTGSVDPEGSYKFTIPSTMGRGDYIVNLSSASGEAESDTPFSVVSQAITVSNKSFGVAPINDGDEAQPTRAYITFSYKLNNNGSTDIYISKDVSKALTYISPGGDLELSSAYQRSTPASVTGDSQAAYIIPAGQSRTFNHGGFGTLAPEAKSKYRMSAIITKILFGYSAADSAKYYLQTASDLQGLTTSSVELYPAKKAAVMVPPPPVSTGIAGSDSCPAFNTDLRIGNIGDDVKALQKFLISKGFDIESVASGRDKRGYFGTDTSKALVKYQTSTGILADGLLGPVTREKINENCAPSSRTSLVATANKDTAQSRNIVVDSTDGVRAVNMQTVDIKSIGGDSKLSNLKAEVIMRESTYAAPLSLYLYDGTTLLSSVAVTVINGSATVNFQDLDITIAEDTIKTLTIKADFATTASGTVRTEMLGIVGNAVRLYQNPAEWRLINATIISHAGAPNVAPNSVSGTIVLNVRPHGGIMIKPKGSDFGIAFSAADGSIIPVTPSVAVTPSSPSIGSDSQYVITISGTLYSSNALFKTSQPVSMKITGINSSVGGAVATSQTSELEGFHTTALYLNKGSEVKEKETSPITVAIKADKTSADSGQTINFSVTTPANTVKTAVSISCPLGVSFLLTGFECNKLVSLGKDFRGFSAAFINRANVAQNIQVKFYANTSDREGSVEAFPLTISIGANKDKATDTAPASVKAEQQVQVEQKQPTTLKTLIQSIFTPTKPTATPTPTAMYSPTATYTPIYTPVYTPTYTSTPSPTYSPTSTYSPSYSPSSSPSYTPSYSPTPTYSPTSTYTPPVTTTSPSASPSSSPTASVTSTPTPTPTTTTAPVAAAVVNLTASAYSITSGTAVNVSWSSTGAVSCTSNWGYAGTSGNLTFYPGSSTTYSLTCNNSAGAGTTKNLYIQVNTPPASSTSSPSPSSSPTSLLPMISNQNATLWDAIAEWFDSF